MNNLLVICGPTATGKSALAINLAKQFNGEVISADSRQVYRGLDIGTAKVTHDEMQGVPHHMIDIANPMDYFSVVDFQNQAQQIIADIHARGKLPIVCGGTGMYIDAVVYGTKFPEVPANHQLRAELEKLSAADLYEKLQELDPERAMEIDEHNPVRLIRAIEIATVLGSVPKIEIRQPQYTSYFVGLELPKEILRERIEQRIKDRIPALFDEIKKLLDQGISPERLHSFGLEYRYGSEYVEGKLTESEFIEILTNKTWQFAKRQMLWFQKNKTIHWFDPINEQQKILESVQNFLSY